MMSGDKDLEQLKKEAAAKARELAKKKMAEKQANETEAVKEQPAETPTVQSNENTETATTEDDIEIAKKKAAAAAKAKAAAMAKQRAAELAKEKEIEGETGDDLELAKKKAAAAAKAKAAAMAKQRAAELAKEKANEGEAGDDLELAKKKAAAAAKAKAAAMAKQRAAELAKEKANEGKAGDDLELAKKKAAAAAKAKAAAAAKAKAEALAKAKAAGASSGDSEEDLAAAKAKAIAAAKAKAAAAAKAKALAAQKGESEETQEEKKPSPNQPYLDKYVKVIKEHLGEDVLEDYYINTLSKDVPTLVAKPETYYKIAEFLKYNEQLGFDYLSDLHGSDFETHMEVYLHLYSFKNQQSVALKVKIDRDKPEIDSVQPLWEGANWPEREAYDLLGIIFKGHPNLTRIFLPDDWVGHPLRKDYEPYDVEV
jgi:NADH-quinone oxidoreductase subunit C